MWYVRDLLCELLVVPRRTTGFAVFLPFFPPSKTWMHPVVLLCFQIYCMHTVLLKQQQWY